MRERRVVIVAFDGVQSLDLTGPLDVFKTANLYIKHGRPYSVTVIAPTKGPVATSSGLALLPDATLSRTRESLDTLVVTGGDGFISAMRDVRLISGVRRLAAKSRRVASVCSGAFILAEAGLLEGRRATTHWEACEFFSQRYPSIEVDENSIYVKDDKYWTSAGVTAGIDLALALVEGDQGRDVALAVARRLVVFLHRPGNQAQFSVQLSSQFAERDPIREAQRFVLDHPEEVLTVDALAERAGMSERNFARVFAAEVGTTPGRYVEQTRLETARRLLEETNETMDAIARRCGFGTTETLRRSLIRAVGVSPAEYRRRFRTAVPVP
jgi:transcriptional regulator GlxA family with amidase domain